MKISVLTKILVVYVIFLLVKCKFHNGIYSTLIRLHTFLHDEYLESQAIIFYFDTDHDRSEIFWAVIDSVPLRSGAIPIIF